MTEAFKSPSRSESKHPDGSDKLTRDEWLRELECGELIYLTPPMARELAGYLRSVASETTCRDAALEEAAKVCEVVQGGMIEDEGNGGVSHDACAKECADGIRALKSKSVVASTAFKGEPEAWLVQHPVNDKCSDRYTFANEDKRKAEQLVRDLEENGWPNIELVPLFRTSPSSLAFNGDKPGRGSA